MADSSEDESSDSSDNLSVISDEDFVVSSSSEAGVREDEVEIEQGSAVFLLCLEKERVVNLDLQLNHPSREKKSPTGNSALSNDTEIDDLTSWIFY